MMRSTEDTDSRDAVQKLKSRLAIALNFWFVVEDRAKKSQGNDWPDQLGISSKSQ